jgi:predicted PurR-regulated permease PerM
MKRDLMILILFTVILILVVVNFKSVTRGVWFFVMLFQPLILGLVIAFILNKPCMLIERMLKRMRFFSKNKAAARGISVASVFIIVLLLCVLFVSIVIPQLIESIQILIKSAGGNLGNLQSIIDQATEFFGIDEIDLSSLGSMILSSINAWGSSVTAILSQIISITTGLISFFATLVISLIFSIYLLSGKEPLLTKCKTVLASYLPEKVYSKGSYVMEVVIRTFERYVVGQLTEALILGALCFAGMVIFRFDYPLLIGVLIGVTALVPVVGAYIGGFVAFLLLLIISPAEALWFLLFLVVLQQFEGNVIYPRVVGGSLELPSILVLLAVVVGGGLAGPLGILLGIPTATVIYTLVKNDFRIRSEKNR